MILKLSENLNNDFLTGEKKIELLLLVALHFNHLI